jgi:hypothetical protein
MNNSWFWIMACRYHKCLNTNFSCKTLVIHVKFFHPLMMQVKMLWVSLELKCLAQNIFTACKIQLACDHASECLVFWILCVYVCMVLWQNVKNIIFGTVDLEHLISFCVEWHLSVHVTIIQDPPKKCIHTLTDGICVLFSKLNWIIITICSMAFSQQMPLLAWLRSCDVWRMIVKEDGRSTVDVRGMKIHFKVVYQVWKCHRSPTSVEAWVKLSFHWRTSVTFSNLIYHFKMDFRSSNVNRAPAIFFHYHMSYVTWSEKSCD